MYIYMSIYFYLYPSIYIPCLCLRPWSHGLTDPSADTNVPYGRGGLGHRCAGHAAVLSRQAQVRRGGPLSEQRETAGRLQMFVTNGSGGVIKINALPEFA